MGKKVTTESKPPRLKPPWLILEGKAEQLVRGFTSHTRLLIADPPYNFGMNYSDYHDKQPAAKYWSWTQQWLQAVLPILADDASLWLFYPDEWVSEVDLFCRKELKLTRRSMVQWLFTFGQANQKGFTRSHLHLLYYVRDPKNYTFNADQVRVPSARQAVYGDKRANAKGKLPDDTWALLKPQIEAAVPPHGDAWMQSRVCGTFKARCPHSPNQIPVPLLQRIIRACSNPGDLVLDPFGGTFSTGEAALSLGRYFVGFDVSPICVSEGRKRLAALCPGQKVKAS